MLFPLVKKVNTSNPFIAVYQYIAIGVLGVCFYMTGDLSSIGSTPKPVQAVGALSSSTDLGELENKPIETKIKFYKLISGLVDFCKNSERVRGNLQLKDIVVEVLLTYRLENEIYFQPIIDKKVDEAGIKKDASLADIKDKVISVFEELGNSIKTSIENDLAKAKK